MPLTATYTEAATAEASVTAAQKLTLALLFNPAVTLLGIYPEEMKAGSQKIPGQHVHSNILHKGRGETEVSMDRQKDARCGTYINQNIIQPF